MSSSQWAKDYCKELHAKDKRRKKFWIAHVRKVGWVVLDNFDELKKGEKHLLTCFLYIVR